jgi:hypothetical protein
MASGPRPLNILLSPDKAEECTYILGCPKKIKPFRLDPGSRNNGPSPLDSRPTLDIGYRDIVHATSRSVKRSFFLPAILVDNNPVPQQQQDPVAQQQQMPRACRTHEDDLISSFLSMLSFATNKEIEGDDVI